MIEGLQAGICIGFGIFCAVAGCGTALKVVQWIGKRLGVKALDA